jgi:predicted small lipoprotein YifL
MRKVQISITVGALAALYVLGGCGQPGPLQAKPADAATQAKFGSQASVVDLGYRGGKTISLELLPPAEQGFKQFGLLAVQHHWTANDIFLYTATLKVWDGTAYAAIGSGVSTTVDPKAAAPQTKAVFTNLKQGKKYQVGIVATGNDGGTAGTTTLNSANPTNVVYDFTATQDVQDTLSSSAAITFDDVSFSGSATTTLTTPSDGAYANPAATEAGSAE